MDVPKIEVPVGERAVVLIVDDTPAKLVALGGIVSGMDLEIVTATSGEQALRHLLKRDFAVILLDVRMPVMDGFETATLIRSRPRSEYTPIIFVTAEANSEADRFSGYALGAVDIIYSPIIPDILRTKVRVFVDLFYLQRQVLLHNEQLESLVEQRTAQLQAANQELVAFSYSMSHDLRTPLSAINGFSTLLGKEIGAGAASERSTHYLARIRAGALQMGELIDALLSLAQLSRTDLRRDRVDLSALAQTILNGYREREPGRVAQIDIQPELVVEGDPRLLQQVLDNLLGNAWKFSAKQARSEIMFGHEKASAGETVYFVRDNGAGFDMAYSEKLFGAFQRLHTAAEFAGTGIGLATVQRIVMRHDGRIWAESAPGRGATFYFTLGDRFLKTG
ncbi:ATP-binding protein [Polaromonas sp.]|uniref:sensor histidine kinase n=1 Tax=Polaromonas sp. TaxID=1869339 RepID=UPI003563F62D